jgi:glucose-6-phosphate dehydrogenase assembly protein OpcA
MNASWWKGLPNSRNGTPRKLAQHRARVIVDLLISIHGIPSDRLSAVGRDPEGSGEGSRKAVAFFLDREGN